MCRSPLSKSTSGHCKPSISQPRSSQARTVNIVLYGSGAAAMIFTSSLRKNRASIRTRRMEVQCSSNPPSGTHSPRSWPFSTSTRRVLRTFSTVLRDKPALLISSRRPVELLRRSHRDPACQSADDMDLEMRIRCPNRGALPSC